MGSQRIRYIDEAKALGIMLVILGHCVWLKEIPGLPRIIYSFHIPLFFIISGFFIKPMQINVAIKKYACTYLKAYYTAVIIALCCVLFISFFIEPKVENIIKDWIIRTLFASGAKQGYYTSNIPIIGPLWFLWALFWACVVYSFFLYLRLGNPIKALIIVFGLAFSVITIDYVKFPLSIQAGCIALFFIWIGQMIKEYNYIEVVEKVIKNSYYISLFGFLLWGGSIYITVVDFGMCRIGCGPINVFVSIYISLIILCILKNVKLPNFVGDAIGTHTLSILCGHFTLHYIFYTFGWPAKCFPFSPIINLIIEYLMEVGGAFVFAVVYVKLGIIRK